MTLSLYSYLDQGQNRLKNGNFMSVRGEVQNVKGPDTFWTDKARIPSALAAALVDDDTPLPDFIGGWPITGGPARILVDPVINGDPMLSYDGGRLLGVSFDARGTVVMEQEVEDIEPFRGQGITVQLGGVSIEGVIIVQVEVDFGDGFTLLGAVSSQSFGRYRRVSFGTDVPLGLTKLGVRIQLIASRSSFVGISGVAALLGRYQQATPFVDSPSDRVVPPGTIIYMQGDSCPAGWTEEIEDDQFFPVAVTGNALTVDGGVAVFGTDFHNHKVDGALNNPDVFDGNAASTIVQRVYTHFSPRPGPPAGPTQADFLVSPDAAFILTENHRHDTEFNESETVPLFKTFRVCRKV